MNIIADMHLNGQGVPSNESMTYVWYSLSAAVGNPKGIDAKNTLSKNLSAQQLAKSKLLTQNYAQDYLEPYVISWSLE